MFSVRFDQCRLIPCSYSPWSAHLRDDKSERPEDPFGAAFEVVEDKGTLEEIYFDQSARIGNASLAFVTLVDDAGEGDVGRKSRSDA